MKQKQFTRTTQITGLALLSGVLVGAMLPSPAQAKPFPKKGYILQGQGAADIGRRASKLDAQRAALRMMSRLMKWFPNEEVYDVKWMIFDRTNKPQFGAITFAEADGKVDEYNLDHSKDGYTNKWLTLYGDAPAIYVGVNPTIMRKVAKSGGSMRDLQRYGVFNALEEEVD